MSWASNNPGWRNSEHVKNDPTPQPPPGRERRRKRRLHKRAEERRTVQLDGEGNAEKGLRDGRRSVNTGPKCRGIFLIWFLQIP
jgi:hypothetical protein